MSLSARPAAATETLRLWVPVFTGAQVRQAEAPLLEAGEGPALMRRAAHGLAQQVLALLKARGGVYGAAVTALIGSGNNGGDALYALAMLRRRGVAATAVLVGTRTHVEGLRSLRAVGGRIVEAGPASAGSSGGGPHPVVPPETAVLIDAVLGTGARGEFRLPEVSGLREIAGSRRCLTVACDIPSGLEADTGRTLGEVLPADHTVTFGGLKQGLLTGEGALLSGAIHQVDIALGGELPTPAAWTLGEQVITAPAPGHSRWRDSREQDDGPASPGEGGWLERKTALMHSELPPAPPAGLRGEMPGPALSLPRPTPRDHKYSRGVLHAVVGSEQYPGAAQLTVGAAVAVGLGMVTVRAEDSVCQRLTAAHPEVVASSRRSRESLDRASAAVVGPGIGNDGFQSRAMYEVLEWAQEEHPVVLDASALDQLHGTDLNEGGLSPNILLTPHQGELRRLMEHAGRADLLPLLQEDAAGALRRMAEHLHATMLLKGSSTLVVAPPAKSASPAAEDSAGGERELVDVEGGVPDSGVLVILRAFAPGLATAGTGDVLSGVLGALAAAEPQRPLWQTAVLGARLHAEAAQRIDPSGEGRFGASDLFDALR